MIHSRNNKVAARVFFVLLALLLLISFVLYVPALRKSGKAKLPIIMYHHLSFDAKEMSDYTITPKQFEDDLIYLKSEGYEFVSLPQVEAFVHNRGELPEKPIMITFDDGYESFYTEAFPIIKRQNAKAVVSIIARYSDEQGNHLKKFADFKFLSFEEIKQLGEGPIDIISHTYDLHKLGKEHRGALSDEGESFASYKKRLTDDNSKFQEKLTAVLGHSVNEIAYPNGLFNKDTTRIVRQMGMSAALTSEWHTNHLTKFNYKGLYKLGRFNRPNGKSSAEYFESVLHISWDKKDAQKGSNPKYT